MNRRKIIFQYIVIIFFIYSIIGWIYEDIIEVLIKKEGRSSGALVGPYLPVYGTGALFILLFVKDLISTRILLFNVNITPLLIFFIIIVVTTIIELIGSYFLEITRGYWMWDYTTYNFNFQGRISLQTSLLFGIGGTFLVYVFQPFLERRISKLSLNTINVTSSILWVVIIAEILYFFIG
ncbi:putative ABC transporter permease [Miniphocaeibacter massiliensis]|uniref:putative ABC transporter permease n=1 Tax=Miniphocaeibacter massiliensis TaxID=2041841 RepID=UPI000C1C7ADC|nr:putative ABC transporter permease [Miniphocaeibacter massiliensis]